MKITLDYARYLALITICGGAKGYIDGVCQAQPYSRQAEVGRAIAGRLDAALNSVMDRAELVAKDEA